MWNSLKARLRQGFRTGKFPYAEPVLPELFRGKPEISPQNCPACGKCEAICPVNAVSIKDNSPEIDTGKCIFCGKCETVCGGNVIKFSREYRLAAMHRDKLVVGKDTDQSPEKASDEIFRKFCGRSLKIRQVSAGGCAACELDFNVLNTLAWDMGRFGIQVVASPRHADCILITGPISRNMMLALRKSYDAAPRPVWIIACGSCAVSGGLYANSDQCISVEEMDLKPDLYVPGCPPHPTTLLEGILRLMGRKIES